MPLKKKNRIALKPMLVLLALVLTVGIASSIAYLAFKTPKITNEFSPAYVECLVQEEFANGVKSNVSVQNTGNIPAYIRVAIVVNWVKDQDDNNSNQGNIVLNTVPKLGVDYTLEISDQGWQKGKDGYYYYANAVDVNASTSVLIKKATEIQAPEGYSLNIQVLASAIQSEPEKAVENVWNVYVNNGVLIPR